MTVTDERWLGKMALNRMVGEMAGITQNLRGGACVGADPDVFFPSGALTPPEQAKQIGKAKTVCQNCDLRIECLEGALERNEPYGVWGGLTGNERRALKKLRGRTVPPPETSGDETDERRIGLLNQGMTDRQIADAEGINSNSITHWRNRRGLRGNFVR